MKSLGLLAVAVAAGLVACQSGAAAERTYYIAAQEADWDYFPLKRDMMMNMEIGDSEEIFVTQGEGRIGSVYRKALYVEFTDETFTQVKEKPSYLGLVGPIIRAEVGDTIHIVFKNMASRPYSIHPHGVFYTKPNEGAFTHDTPQAGTGNSVEPGDTYTYEWIVPERAGPGPADPSSIVWPYHSHVHSVEDSNSGLVGGMVITAAGMANPDGSPSDVDQEYLTLFTVFDENSSWYLEENIDRFAGGLNSVELDEDEFGESNLMHAMNGFVYGNMPMPSMQVGEKVRWHVIALGTEVDLHTPHWHGNTAVVDGHRVDTVSLLPATTVTADMVPDAEGMWMYHCHVNDHIAAGMTGMYEVLPRQ